MGVMCKYFQQGRCRFGSQCKFQHYEDGGGGRVTDQYHYYKPEKPDSNVILQAVQQEVLTSDKGGQWPLSCFAPLKEYGNVVGWEDISPEELRWQTYLSRQSGNLDDWLKQLQELYQKAQRNKNLMLNPTMETYSVLESIFKKDSTSSFSFAQAPNQAQNTFISGSFGNNSVSSAQQGQAGTSIFGGSSTAFSAPANTSQNTFNTTASSHSANIFGGGGAVSASAQPTPFFGASSSSPSIFGNAQPTFSRNIFGNAQSAPTTNVFGNTANAASPSANVFGNTANAASPSANVFGNTANAASPSANVFGNAANAPSSVSVFGNTANIPPSANVFGNTASTIASSSANVFGAATNSAVPSTNVFGAVGHMSSIFGGQQQQPGFTGQGFGGQTFGGFENAPQHQGFSSQTTGSSIFGNTNQFESKQNPPIAGDDIYTPMSELTEDTLALFKSDKYEMGQIPIVPPPKELCS